MREGCWWVSRRQYDRGSSDGSGRIVGIGGSQADGAQIRFISPVAQCHATGT